MEVSHFVDAVSSAIVSLSQEGGQHVEVIAHHILITSLYYIAEQAMLQIARRRPSRKTIMMVLGASKHFSTIS